MLNKSLHHHPKRDSRHPKRDSRFEQWIVRQVRAQKLNLDEKRVTISFGLILLLLAVLTTVGCGSSNESSEPSLNSAGDVASDKQLNEENNGKEAPQNHLAKARQKLSMRLWDDAAEAAALELVKSPNNEEALLVAAKAEVGRGKDEVAIQYASNIEDTSRLIVEATNLRVESLYRLKRFSEAADLLEASIQREPTRWLWRHRAWQLLNRLGKREQASMQAEMLCRAGQATEAELNSLLRRTEAFPTMLGTGETAEKWFEPGLGIARWKFTEGKYREALAALDEAKEKQPLSPAGQALYGRLLSETQALDAFPRWHAQVDREKVSKLGDYWAAMGTYFFDLQAYETSARCLLESIVRNPTDRRTMQRLAKVFDALGEPEQGEQYRRRGVAMAQTEAASDSLQSIAISDNRARLELRKQLMKQTVGLERPFESLAWASLVFPSSAIQQLQSIAEQRNTLLQSADARSMSRQAALVGTEIRDYPLGEPFDQLTKIESNDSGNTKDREIKPLAAPSLTNVAASVGLDFQWYQDTEMNLASIPIHESIGGGIAILDYDLDGWPDLYLSQGSGEPPTDQCTRSNALTRNQTGKFKEVTEETNTEDYHYGSGVTAGDVNQDGWIDLFVGSLGQNRLLINNGDGTFRDGTPHLGTNIDDQFTTSLGIADIDGDSLPDLFESVYIEMEGAFALPEIGKDGKEVQPSPLEFYAESDRWYKNQGDGRFEVLPISRENARPGTSLGLIITNFDQQPGNEIFVGNDVRPNHFLRHDGRAGDALLNSADALGLANGFSGAANGCMGIAAGDFNRDNHLDLHITNFNGESANLYLQNNANGFTDFAIRYQLDTTSMPFVGFGTKAVDIDCDGWLDLAVTNGHIFDMSQYGEGFKMPPQLLMNLGTRFELTNVLDDSDYWTGKYLGRSMASVDYNRDGKIDLLINHLDQPLALMENRTQTSGTCVEVELVGTASERDAIGTVVTVESNDDALTSWVTAGDGYLSSDEPYLRFGLGNQSKASTISIRWPSGVQQSFDAPEPGRYLIVEGQDTLHSRSGN